MRRVDVELFELLETSQLCPVKAFLGLEIEELKDHSSGAIESWAAVFRFPSGNCMTP